MTVVTVNPRSGLVFIVLLVLIDGIGFRIILPVMPALIIELTGVTRSQASRLAGWLVVVNLCRHAVVFCAGHGQSW